MSEEINRLKQNIANFMKYNDLSKKEVCKKVNIKESEYHTLLENPIQDRKVLFAFLKAFKLSFVDFITKDYAPITGVHMLFSYKIKEL